MRDTETDRQTDRQTDRERRERERERKKERERYNVVVSWYLRDGSAQTIVLAATLRNEAADQTFHFTQLQCTDTGPTSSSAVPMMPSDWRGSHWSTLVKSLVGLDTEISPTPPPPPPPPFGENGN